MSDAAAPVGDVKFGNNANRPMTGRDPHEVGRSATPLELLYDLTFVVAFSVAGNQMAHLIADGHWQQGIFGFVFATFAVVWAWIGYTWFASAYDNYDWFMRIATMIQMAGVLVLALGLPEMFHGLVEGWELHLQIMVWGYIIMRIPMLSMWLRAARHDPSRRNTCLTYARGMAVTQTLWIIISFTHFNFLTTLLIVSALIFVEMLIPYLAETRYEGTSWHAHHIAERHGLLVIITLGEGIVGTVITLQTVIEHQGWSLEAAMIGVAGLSLTFAIWWMYFVVPFGDVLSKHPQRGFGWGYGHLPIFGVITAIGAGLHVCAYVLEGKSEVSAAAAVAAVAIPVVLTFAISSRLVHYVIDSRDERPSIMLTLLQVMPLVSLAVVYLTGSIGWALLAITVAPWMMVIWFERVGHEQVGASLERTLSEA